MYAAVAEARVACLSKLSWAFGLSYWIGWVIVVFIMFGSEIWTSIDPN